MTLHRGSQPNDRVARHQTIGIEDDHLLVCTAEPSDPLGDVAGLALRVLPTTPVEDVVVSARPLAEGEEGCLLRNPDVWVGGVTQDEDVEVCDRVGLFERFMDRLQPRYYPRWALVVGWHQQRGPRC